MFESESDVVESFLGGPVTTAALAAIVGQLRDHGCVADSDAERITHIRLLETLKSVVSGVQAQLTADVARSREAELALIATASVRDKSRRDVGAQIALARRVSPALGARLVGLAEVLTIEMPQLNDALRRGDLDEYQAMVVVAETAALTRADRHTVDAELAPRYGSMTPRQAGGAAARIGYRLDPEQAVRRTSKAQRDRRVTLRPAPDTMTYLTALLPAVEGVAVYAALTRHAATATATGDSRGRGALMSDELVARLLQPATSPGDQAGSADDGTVQCQVRDSEAPRSESVQHETHIEPTRHLADGLSGVPAGVDIEIQLVMSDRTLLDGDNESAILTGHGPIPAPLARHLVRAADPRTTVWVRRLYTDPDSGSLVRSDRRRRLFSQTDRKLLIARDQVCRTPWCGAPIQHADHTIPHAAGGPTQTDNGAGLCAACNQVKEQPGWRTETTDNGDILTTTPTGHTYLGRPPDPPRSPPWTHHAA